MKASHFKLSILLAANVFAKHGGRPARDPFDQNGAVIARNPKGEVAFHSATGAIDSDWRSRIDKRFTSLRGAAALIVMLAHYQYIRFLPALPAFKY